MIRSQDYAQRAYSLVSSMRGHALETKYRTLALNFPNMILQAGLSQAIGFLLAKGKDEHALLLEHLAELLIRQQDKDALHKIVINAELSQYQLLTRKALDASSWLKRYTQALLEGES